MIQTCSFLYNPGRLDLHPFLGVALGGCFCKNCEKEAISQGIDFAAMKAAVKKWADLLIAEDLQNIEDRLMLKQGNSTSTMFLLEDPLFYEWLRFRCNTITKYLKGISDAIHSVNPKIDFRFNTCWQEQELIGQNLRAIAPHVNSIRMMDYAEQTGNDELVSRKGLWLANVRRQAGEDKTIIGGIAPRAKATVELIKKGIRIVALGGADGLSYGFYDGAKFENLRAIREAMEECEITLAPSSR
jgi:hypothetical protein